MTRFQRSVSILNVLSYNFMLGLIFSVLQNGLLYRLNSHLG